MIQSIQSNLTARMKVGLVVTLGLVIAAASSATASEGKTLESDLDEVIASDVTGYFLPVALTGTVASLVLEDDYKGAEQFGKIMATTSAITSLLKSTTGLSRPDGNRDGFPSGHASAAFAWASFMADRHPKNKWYYYGAASVVGWTRVELNRHYTYQVVAGALLGRLVADHFTGKKRSALLDRVSFEAPPTGRPASAELFTKVTLRKWTW